MATRATRKQYAGLLGGALILAIVLGILAPAAQAAPFATVWMEARINLSANPYTTGPLAVATGQKIDYKIYVQIANPTVSNTGAGVTLSSLTESGSMFYPSTWPLEPDPAPSGALDANGINGMKFNLYQNSADLVQASFTTTGAVWGSQTVDVARTWDGEATATWGVGAGANKGSSAARPGGPTTIKNLIGVRPILPSGFYAGVAADGSTIPMMVISGTTSAMSGTTGSVTQSKLDSFIRLSQITPSDVSVATTMRVNGQSPAGVISEYTSWISDPVTVYAGITLYTPWREAVLPIGGYEDDLTGSLLLTANEGGSHNTTVTYDWQIASGTPVHRITHSPTLMLTQEELEGLGVGGHTITLTVTTGDMGGQSQTTAPLTLTPEPATMALLSLGGLVAFLRRRVR